MADDEEYEEVVEVRLKTDSDSQVFYAMTIKAV